MKSNAKYVLSAILLSLSLVTSGCGTASNTEQSNSNPAAQNHTEAHSASSASLASTASAAPNEAPAPTPVQENNKLPDGQYLLNYKMVDGVKEFELTAKVVKWQTEDGQIKEAWAYNGTVPGPQIRVTEGDKVRVKFKNELPESTVLHMHGLHLPNNMDGVAGVTQDEIKPGGSFNYEFTAQPAGTHMYHSHFNTVHQVDKGLFGNIIVEPKTNKEMKDYTFMLSDGGMGYLINGKSFPSTEKIELKAGETVKLRFSNVGNQVHPMHLHGHHFKIVGKDGYTYTEAQQVQDDTLSINPGERYDIELTPTEKGLWLFHCHVLFHVHGDQGKDTGMILVFDVK